MHIFLAARAFGAEQAVYSGQQDPTMEAQFKEIVTKWGGNFTVEYIPDESEQLKTWKQAGRELIHLTMYGLPIQKVIEEIRCSPRDKVIVIGGAKVKRSIYRVADWNVAITSQPHSEISALSVFLHLLFEGTELEKTHDSAQFQIIPQARGKKVIQTE
jgi:tRNA (cytidine56-2'-O)-methyltransferase